MKSATLCATNVWQIVRQAGVEVKQKQDTAKKIVHHTPPRYLGGPCRSPCIFGVCCSFYRVLLPHSRQAVEDWRETATFCAMTRKQNLESEWYQFNEKKMLMPGTLPGASRLQNKQLTATTNGWGLPKNR